MSKSYIDINSNNILIQTPYDKLKKTDFLNDMARANRVMLSSLANAGTAIYAILLAQLTKVILSAQNKLNIPTAQVRTKHIKFTLLINSKFWYDCSFEQRIGLLIHEATHILYEHPFESINYPNKDLFQIACDLFVNSFIMDMLGEEFIPGCANTYEWNKVQTKANLLGRNLLDGTITEKEYIESIEKLPFRPVVPDDYIQYGLSRDVCIKSGVNKIYDILYEIDNEEKEQMISAFSCPYPEGSQGEEESNAEGESNSNNEDDNNEDDSNNGKDNQGKGDSDKEIPPNPNNAPDKNPLKHNHEEISDKPTAYKQTVKAQLRKTIEDILSDSTVSKSIGNLPDSLKQRLTDLLTVKQPAEDYKAIIRNWIGAHANEYRVKRTRVKPNLIIPENPRLRIYQDKRILFVIDSSGSMGLDTDVKEVLEEAIIFKERTGHEFYVQDWDTKAHGKPWLLENIDKVNERLRTKGIKGRGGTDLNGINKYLENSKMKFTGVVYLTDGFVYAPKKRPKVPFMLIVTSTGPNTDNLKTQYNWEDYKIVKITKDLN